VRQDWELEDWLARQAVEDLIYRYSDSVTRGDHEHTATLFAPDAVWQEVGGAGQPSQRPMSNARGTSTITLTTRIATTRATDRGAPERFLRPMARH
jgi:SnoaL-like domain